MKFSKLFASAVLGISVLSSSVWASVDVYQCRNENSSSKIEIISNSNGVFFAAIVSLCGDQPCNASNSNLTALPANAAYLSECRGYLGGLGGNTLSCKTPAENDFTLVMNSYTLYPVNAIYKNAKLGDCHKQLSN